MSGTELQWAVRSRRAQSIRGHRLPHHRLSQPLAHVHPEIYELERQGIAIFPISINKVAANELLSDLDRSDATRTFTIKHTSPLRAVVADTRFTLSSPKAVIEVSDPDRRGRPFG